MRMGKKIFYVAPSVDVMDICGESILAASSEDLSSIKKLDYGKAMGWPSSSSVRDNDTEWGDLWANNSSTSSRGSMFGRGGW